MPITQTFSRSARAVAGWAIATTLFATAAAAPSTNTELGSKSLTTIFGSLWAPKEEYVPFTGEPARSTLIEPPPGYRTPSPAQPYGVGRDKWVAPVIDKNEPAK